jgi:hypothetical protein
MLAGLAPGGRPRHDGPSALQKNCWLT